jgi:transcriptional regulator with XRE-family HTH domain
MKCETGTLPDALRLLRHARQFSLRDLETASRVPRSLIYAYECGQRKASIFVLHKLACAMGVGLGALEIASEFHLAIRRYADGMLKP